MSMQTEYYLGVDGQRRGPFSLEELRAQNVGATSLVWHKGLAAWTKAEELPELHGESLLGPPPLPPPSSIMPITTATADRKRPWNPRTIALLSIACSPLWGGFMAVANAKRLGLPASLRPIGLGVGWVVVGATLNLLLGEGYFRSFGLYLGSVYGLWGISLQDQSKVYEVNRISESGEVSWIVPGIVGAPFAMLAFLAMVIGPFMPLEPREVCQRLIDADTDAEFKRYATLNLQPALIALNKASERGEKSDYELLGEEPLADSPAYLVGYRGSTTDNGKTVTINGFFHLIPIDGEWKVEEMYLTGASDRSWQEPVPISANYQDILHADGIAKASQKKQLSVDPTPAYWQSLAKKPFTWVVAWRILAATGLTAVGVWKFFGVDKSSKVPNHG